MFLRFALCILLLAPIVHSVADSHEDAAKASLAAFLGAWNSGDVATVRDTLHFPHLTLFRELVVAETAADFTVDFAAMKENEDWSRSTFGEMKVVASAPDQVHIETSFARYDSAGQAYRSGRVFYIVTQKDGRWGMQFRTALLPEESETAIASADVVDAFFASWNIADNKALHQTIHFPHAFLIGGGRVSLAKGPDEMITDFDRLRREEGWRETTFDEFRVHHADRQKALTYLTFHRRNAEGEIYRSAPVLWIVTRDGDSAGIQLRAILRFN